MPPPYEPFTWRQIKPGRWERDVDEVEQFYTTLVKRFKGSGAVFFALTAHVSFAVANNPTSCSNEARALNALRMAWLRLRHDHPTIASWVEYNHDAKKCHKVYETFDEEGEATWLKDTFQIISDCQSGQEWCNSKPPVPGLPTLFLIKHAPANDHFGADLVLRAHHEIIDGIGSLHLLNNLFQYASEAFDHPKGFRIPEFGDEWKNLSPPLKTAASIPELHVPEQDATLKGIMDRNLAVLEEAEIAQIPHQSGPTVPGCHKRVALTLSEEQTQQLLAASKKLDASITHIYHAAIAIIVRDLQTREPQERVVRYISYSPINERSQCKEPYNKPEHAASVYHSVSGQSLAIDLTVPPLANSNPTPEERKSEFAETVKQVKDYYLNMRDDKEHIRLVPSYWALSTPPYPPGVEDPPVPPPNPAPSASIASLGMIENLLSPTHGQFELNDPWVTGDELGTGLGLFLGTFRGRMSLSAAFNDAWHDGNDAKDFVTRCNNLVIEML
jgi:hypothetical protein